MNVDQLLYDYVTEGIRQNHNHCVGIEIEFPLVRTEGGSIDLGVVEPMFQALEQIGYHRFKADDQARPIAAQDADGNTLTFDTCFENVEFASCRAETFWSLYDRFRLTVQTLQAALIPLGHCVLGIGANPLIKHPHPVKSELTQAIAEYFDEHPSKRSIAKDFYCMISSEQVHFNTTVEEMPRIIEAFTRLDWLNILLFSDSYSRIGEVNFLCARNELYMRSSFHKIGLVGAQPLPMDSAEDLARDYRDVSLFMRRRGGRLEVFDPVTVKAYFDRPDALEEDIHCLDLERNIVTTSYGTLEYRILCTQPFDEAFVPSAFNLGLRVKLEQTLALAREFDQSHKLPDPNERNRQASMGKHPFAAVGDVERYAQKLLELSEQGLLERGFGEEQLLAPLKARASLLDSPARRLERDLDKIGLKAAVLKRAELGNSLHAK